VVKGNLAGLYGYYSKTIAQKPELFVMHLSEAEICGLRNSSIPKIAIIKGADIRQCVVDEEDAIIYLWAPKCKSPFCIPINLAQQQCTLRKATLFIVAEYYDFDKMDELYNTERPIFGIDVDYYRSNLTSKYVKRFISDLATKDIEPARFIRFHKGQIVGAGPTIQDLYKK